MVHNIHTHPMVMIIVFILLSIIIITDAGD